VKRSIGFRVDPASAGNPSTFKLFAKERKIFNDAEVSLVSSDEREAFDEDGGGDEGISLVERGVLTAKIGISRGDRI
jgi:hypothetical protein